MPVVLSSNELHAFCRHRERVSCNVICAFLDDIGAASKSRVHGDDSIAATADKPKIKTTPCTTPGRTAPSLVEGFVTAPEVEEPPKTRAARPCAPAPDHFDSAAAAATEEPRPHLNLVGLESSDASDDEDGPWTSHDSTGQAGPGLHE